MGDAPGQIANAVENNNALLKKIKGDATAIETDRVALLENLPEGSNPSFLPRGIDDLVGSPLALLQAEENRLRGLMSLDSDKANRHKRLSDKMADTAKKISKHDTTIEEATKADAEIARLLQERNDSCRGVFEGIIDEETQLQDLYSPIDDRWRGAAGALSKLDFSINRSVNLQSWAKAGEELLDARAAGDFKGKGSLEKVAEQYLLPAWQSGSAQDVTDAMVGFRSDFG